jgi:hypothetical protein
MDEIVFTHALRAQGFDFDEIRRLKERGELTWLRRGAYARTATTELTVEQRHRRLLEAGSRKGDDPLGPP